MANGTVVKASDVKVGDVQLSYNLKTGALEPSVITYVQSFITNNTYIFNGNLKVDSHETMLINGTWQKAYKAKVGDTLFNGLLGRNVTIYSIKKLDVGGRVYDFLGSPVNDYIANGYVIDIQES